MRVLGSISFTAPNASTFRDGFQTIQPGAQCAGLIIDCSLPFTVGTGGTGAAADLRNILDHYIGSFTLKYGHKQQYSAYLGALGSELRNVYRILSNQEVRNDVIGTVYTPGAKTALVRLVVPFAPRRVNGRLVWPGTSVLRTMKLELREQSSITAGPLNISRTAAAVASYTIVAMLKPGPDNLVHPLSYRTNNQAALTAETEDGQVLAAWDMNAAFASTALTSYTGKVGEDVVVDNAHPEYVHDEWLQQFDAGGSNPEDELTILHFVDPDDSPEQWPVGRFMVRQPTQLVATLQLRYLIIPTVDEGFVEQFVKDEAAARGRSVLATRPPPMSPNARPGYSAVAAAELVDEDAPSFQTRPGVIGLRTGEAFLSVPEPVRASIAAAVAATPESGRTAMLAQQQAALARAVPGALSTSGARVGGRLGSQGIADILRPLGTVPASQAA